MISSNVASSNKDIRPVMGRSLAATLDMRFNNLLWYELIVSLDPCQNSTLFAGNLSWNKVRNDATDCVVGSSSSSSLAASKLVSAHSAASSVRKRFILLMNRSGGMVPFSRYWVSSCSSFRSHLAAEIVPFPSKQPQKVNRGSDWLMIRSSSEDRNGSIEADKRFISQRGESG